MMSDLGLSPPRQPERLTQFDQRAALRRLADSGRLERGCIVIIGIDAVRERLAAQWPAKRAMVWGVVGRMLDRRLGQSGMWVQASEVDYVLCAGDDPHESRTSALKVLRELLEFFLGEQRFEDMRIASVISISEDCELACVAIDPRKIEQEMQPAAPPTAAPAPSSPLSFVSDDHGLALEFAHERIINLRNGASIATRLWPRMRDTRTNHYLSEQWPELLSAASLSAVNAATIDHTRRLYGECDLGLFLSASIYTLAQPRSRSELVRQLEQMNRDPRRPILVELIDITRGTPQGRIAEIVSVLAPHCRKVVARASLDRPPLDLLRGCRLGGLSVDCENLDGDSRSFLLKLSRFAELARSISPLTFALNLKEHSGRELALAAGVTHCGCSAPLQ